MNRTINELKSSHLLNEKITNDLLSSEAKTPQFKMLPKVHKKGSPGRPVVSSIDCHTTKISKYIDNQLQPHVKELKSYVKDSTDFIRKIKSMEKIPDKRILVTMDVRSLFTNIPNKEGIEAVETTLKRENKAKRIISTFLRLILFSTVKTTYRLKAAPWAQNVHQATQIYLWVCLKKDTIHISSYRNNV